MSTSTWRKLPHPPEWLADAAMMLLSLELLLRLLGALAVYLRQELWLPTPLVGLMALALFSAPLALARRHAGLDATSLAGNSARVAALAALAVTPLGQPALGLLLSALGVVAWLCWLPAWLLLRTPRAVLLAVAAASVGQLALRGLELGSGRLDGGGELLLLAALASLVWLQRPQQPTRLPGPRLRAAAAPGLALTVTVLAVGNPARLAAQSGAPAADVMAALLAGLLPALLVALSWSRLAPHTASLRITLALALLAVLALLPLAPLPLAACAQPLLLLCLGSALEQRSPSSEPLARSARGVGLGVLTLLALVFATYASFDLPLPVERDALPAVAGLLLGLCAMGRHARTDDQPRPLAWHPGWGVALLPLLLPFALGEQPPASSQPRTPPERLRVVSWNIRQGHDAGGRLALDRQAETLAALDPDVVAIQELPRGWLIAGGVDGLELLARRLEMQVAWGPTGDAGWGNAILSRWPLDEVVNHRLPDPAGSPLERGLLEARLMLPGGEPLSLLVTHLDHRRPSTRREQVQALITLWNRRQRSVLAGDLNALPRGRELRMLAAAGLFDAWPRAGQGEGLTHTADNPRRRIDYVLATSDLELERVFVLENLLSDHRAVVADIELGARP